jgi:membrane fusion protein (multidrug efflux system)
VIVVCVGGYFAQTMLKGGAADAADTTLAAADSTSDSTAVATGDKDGGKDKDEKKEPDPVPVEVATAAPREISSYYYTTATLDPEREVDVLAKTTGEIVKLYVEEGAMVAAGAMLCQIEDDGPRIELDEARINREKQEAEFKRIESMFKENLISDREYSTAKYEYDIAKNNYEAALLRYEYTKVRAPFAGVVTKRHVELGQNVAVGAQLFELADTDPLLIRMYLPEAEIRDIDVGQIVTINPDNNPDRRLEGKVVRIAPEVDERTGTVKVTAETRGSAMPGSFARIKIVTDTRQGSLTIPRRGLISDAGELYVYVAEADTVRRATVRTGYQDEDYTEIISGVSVGDTVVVVGVGGLRTGTKVKILDATMQDKLVLPKPKNGNDEKETASN